MHALLIEFDKSKWFANIVDYMGATDLEQKLVVARYLISPRMMEESQLAQAWEKPIIRGVTLHEAVLARLRTSTTNEFANELGVTYGAVYSGLLPKLGKWEKHKGLKIVLKGYERRDDEPKYEYEPKPIADERDLFKFDGDDVEGLRINTEGKKPGNPGTIGNYYFDKLADIEALVAEFKRWLTGEDRALFA